MSERRAEVQRTTRETKVRVAVSLDAGEVAVKTGVGFFDHMLEQLGTHARIGLEVEAQGDLEIDAHHTVEDVGIALGDALARALDVKRGINRFGDAHVVMEEALAHVALDLSGRPLLLYGADIPAQRLGDYDSALTEEFLMALCRSGGITMHVRLLTGKNAHHCVEAIFKAVARALGDALSIDPRAPSRIPSTKGVI